MKPDGLRGYCCPHCKAVYEPHTPENTTLGRTCTHCGWFEYSRQRFLMCGTFAGATLVVDKELTASAPLVISDHAYSALRAWVRAAWSQSKQPLALPVSFDDFEKNWKEFLKSMRHMQGPG